MKLLAASILGLGLVDDDGGGSFISIQNVYVDE